MFLTSIDLSDVLYTNDIVGYKNQSCVKQSWSTELKIGEQLLWDPYIEFLAIFLATDPPGVPPLFILLTF